MRGHARKLTTIAMLSAVAYVAVAVCRIPMVLFLKYDPKDVLIVIGGFLFGPWAAFIMSALVAFVEMFTISTTGFIGFVMNLLSSCSFACTASWLYWKDRTRAGAVRGLLAGCVVMVLVMLLWNYLITPLYMGIPRDQIVEILVKAFLPFNVIKGLVNAVMTAILYKPLVSALRRAELVPESFGVEASNQKTGIFLWGFVAVTCVLFWLMLQGKI